MVTDQASGGGRGGIVPFPPRVGILRRHEKTVPMIRVQRIGDAPKTHAVADAIAAMRGPCIGCASCAGICAALIDLFETPDAILLRRG